MDDGIELVVGEKYWFWDEDKKKADICELNYVINSYYPFAVSGRGSYRNISKTDPNDPREELKQYSVLCTTPEEKKIVMDFCGDMMSEEDLKSKLETDLTDYPVIAWLRECNVFTGHSNTPKHTSSTNDLSFQEFCTKFNVQPPQPKLEDLPKSELIKLSPESLADIIENLRQGE